jgi:membrane-associated phospholipid phosphatase
MREAGVGSRVARPINRPFVPSSHCFESFFKHSFRAVTAFTLLVSCLGAPALVSAQILAPVIKVDSVAPTCKLSRWPLIRAIAAPTLLVAAGLASELPGMLYNQYDTREEIGEHFPRFKTQVDDYLVWAPSLALGALLLARVPTRHEHRRTVLWVTAKASVITFATVHVLKITTAHIRPDNSTLNSFPSGHTAQAFLGATLLDYEFRDSAPWVGPAAYVVAGSVGTLRMLNNRHWQSDVLVGAGLGYTIGRLTCAMQRRASKKTTALQMTPLWSPRLGTGLALTWQPHVRARPHALPPGA